MGFSLTVNDTSSWQGEQGINQAQKQGLNIIAWSGNARPSPV
jgi:hypothetical protein